MCKMVIKGKKFVQKGDVKSIECSKSDTYSQFADLAAKAVGLSTTTSGSLVLFNRKGTKILDEPIDVRGKTGEGWTLGDYVAKQKKAGQLLCFGVAKVSNMQLVGPVRS